MRFSITQVQPRHGAGRLMNFAHFPDITMETEVFEELMTTVLVAGLILFMAFIVWDLAKKSKAGRYGTALLFFALGLGVFGFIAKTIIIAVKGL